MKQNGLIDHVIEVLALDICTVDGKAISAEVKSLVKDTDVEVIHGEFRYSNIMGTLLYLSGHSQIDIAHGVNCATCYIFCPRYSHELLLKRT